MLPGTTALWGTSPGAASVMTIMAESYGADMRLVAFMQYCASCWWRPSPRWWRRIFGVTPEHMSRPKWCGSRRSLAGFRRDPGDGGSAR